MVFLDTMALSLREVQAENRHGNGRRNNLIAIFIPNVDHSLPDLAPRKLITPDLGRAPSGPMFGSIGAIKPTPLSGVTSPSSSMSKKKRGMGSSRQVVQTYGAAVGSRV
jgi:hypothetical protein